MKTRQNLILVVFIASLSFGFMMEVQWPWLQKKEAPQQKAKTGQAQASTQTAPKEEPAELKPATPIDKSTTSPTREAVVTEKIVTDVPDTEVVKIQSELNKIINQTKIIQTQGVADRERLKKVLDQVQIQKRLVSNLAQTKIPKMPPHAMDREKIIQNTKVRLLAEEVQKTRAELNNIPKVPPIVKSIPKVEPIIRTEKTQKAS